MKTVVVYYSKHGSAKEIAKRVAEEHACECLDVKKLTTTDAQQVLVVCATYAGMIPKQMKQFLLQLPKDTRIGFLKVGINQTDAQHVLDENFKDTTPSVAYVQCAGGVLDFSKLGLFEKLIIRMINKKQPMLANNDTKGVHSFLNEEAIASFIATSKQ